MSSGQSTASAAEATTAAEASYGSSEAAALRGQRRRRAEKLGGRKTQRQPANTETSCSTSSLLLLLLLLAISWPMALNAAASTERGGDHHSQSVTAKPNFTAEERTMLRQAFLRKFGLDNLAAARTARTSDGAGKRSSTGKPAQVPDYIWALYEAHSTASPGLAPAQTIRHYGPSLVQAVGKGGGARLSFNLSATGRDPAKERVLRAELRLPGWRMTPNGTLNVFVRRRLGVVEEESAAASRNGADFGKRPWLELDGKLLDRAEGTADELHLSLYFPVGNGDVEEMLRTAALIVFSNEEGAGAEEATHGGSKSAAGEGDATTKSMASSRRAKRHVATGGSDESSSNKNAAASSAQRGRRASSTSAAGSSARMGSTTHRHRSHHTGQCRRAQLYVDFADLNWQDWIMAPAGYEAYQCKGRCVHPMSAHLNTTNHAIVQSLIHSIDPSAAPAPSCVPVQMSAISILYRDVNDVIVVKTYADMRVDACGCH